MAEAISWEQHGEIIHKASKQLKNREQILNFKQLCIKREKNLVHGKHPLTSFLTSLTLPIPPIPLPFSDLTTTTTTTTTKLVLEVNSICLINSPSSKSLKIPWMIMACGSDTGSSIKLRHPLTGIQVKTTPTTSLDLIQFHPIIELIQGYDFKYNKNVRKVIVNPSTSTNCLEVLVLYGVGSLGKLTVRVLAETLEREVLGYRWKKLESSNKFRFQYLDDVVKFKKRYCVLNRKGNLYELNVETMEVKCLLVCEPVVDKEVPGHRRKRLVVDPTSEELYMVVREPIKDRVDKGLVVGFKVYKFNEEQEKWVKITHLGNDRLLFVGVKHCFFVTTKDVLGCNYMRNYLVFAANCFTQYRGVDEPDEKLFGKEEDIQVGIYKIGKQNNFSLMSSKYPKFAKLIWLPPTWFSLKGKFNDDDDQEMASNSSNESNSEKDKDEETKLDSSSHNSSSKASDINVTIDLEEDEEEEEEMTQNGSYCKPMEMDNFGPPLPLEYKTPKETYKTRNQKKRKRLGQDVTTEKVSNEKFTHSTPTLVSLACKNCSSLVKFEGVDVKPEYLPTLQTIRVKYGSLFSEASVRDMKIRACALELLAKLVISIQNTTVSSLTDSQASGIKSVVSDLKLMRLNVDWLNDVVKKTLNIQRNKPLIESMVILKKKKSRVENEEKEFLARNARVKQEIEEDMASLSAKIPFSEMIDLDNCLGVGLF